MSELLTLMFRVVLKIVRKIFPGSRHRESSSQTGCFENRNKLFREPSSIAGCFGKHHLPRTTSETAVYHSQLCKSSSGIIISLYERNLTVRSGPTRVFPGWVMGNFPKFTIFCILPTDDYLVFTGISATIYWAASGIAVYQELLRKRPSTAGYFGKHHLLQATSETTVYFVSVCRLL